MASNVNAKTIDGNYPIAGQDNNSQGFRDNFTNIRNNLAIAAFEISTLQSQVTTLQESVDSGTYTMPIASSTVRGGVVIGDNISVTEDGVISIADPFSGSYVDLENKPTIPTDVNQLTDADGLLDVDGLPPQSGNSGKFLTTDGSNASWGIPLFQRKTVSITTGVIPAAGSVDIEITNAAKSYLLYKISTNISAWVRLYANQQSRLADSARLESDDPTSGSGLILEVFTTDSSPILITPAVAGFSAETTPTNSISMRVKNKSLVSSAITVSLEILAME